MMTRLVQVREATLAEQKNEGAEVVFTRVKKAGGGLQYTYTIYGCQCYESWMQWGTSTDVLGDNVDDIEAWRRGDKLKGAVEFSDELAEEMVERMR